MARRFSTLRQTMGTERQTRNAERATALLAAMDLAELRSALAVTQEELGERLSIAQSNVSRLERRDDMLISTLSEVVQALGGELKVTAVFPEGSVEITQFLEEADRGPMRSPAGG